MSGAGTSPQAAAAVDISALSPSRVEAQRRALEAAAKSGSARALAKLAALDKSNAVSAPSLAQPPAPLSTASGFQGLEALLPDVIPFLLAHLSARDQAAVCLAWPSFARTLGIGAAVSATAGASTGELPWWEQKEALLALTSLGRARTAFVAASADSDARVRQVAVEALATLTPADAAAHGDVLMALLKDRDRGVRSAASRVVGGGAGSAYAALGAANAARLFAATHSCGQMAPDMALGGIVEFISSLRGHPRDQPQYDAQRRAAVETVQQHAAHATSAHARALAKLLCAPQPAGPQLAAAEALRALAIGQGAATRGGSLVATHADALAATLECPRTPMAVRIEAVHALREIGVGAVEVHAEAIAAQMAPPPTADRQDNRRMAIAATGALADLGSAARPFLGAHATVAARALRDGLGNGAYATREALRLVAATAPREPRAVIALADALCALLEYFTSPPGGSRWVDEEVETDARKLGQTLDAELRTLLGASGEVAKGDLEDAALRAATEAAARRLKAARASARRKDRKDFLAGAVQGVMAPFAIASYLLSPRRFSNA